MAIVLTTEETTYFSTGSLKRSHSQSHFGTGSSSFQTSSNFSDDYSSLSKSYSHSAPSSSSSSPRLNPAESTEPSNASTPASNFSLASYLDEDDTLAFENPIEGGLGLASHKREGGFLHPPTSSPDDNLEAPPSPKTGDSYTPSPDFDSVIDTPKPDVPEIPEHAEDDTAVSIRPSKQVDYLSHEWREEDIWSSWRYIVNRRGEFPNSERLENASWRTWMKSKNNLRTVPPETLNWLKDCDVTWLYGPLQPGPKSPKNKQNGSGSMSRSSSFVSLKKKPILKKRSMSEVMLQRSLSTASLLKQATAAVQAQETRGILRPSLVRTNTDYTTYAFSSRRMSNTTSSVAVSTSESSGVTSPSVEKKHIHFNEQVEQCIAVEMKGEEDDEIEPEQLDDDSDSSDGIVMMARPRSRKALSSILKNGKRKTQASEGKTIEKLPSTTLKYREDTPEPRETAMKHSTGRSPVISPSSSQETLRPSRKGRVFLDEEDDVVDGFCDPNSDWDTSANDGTNMHRSTSSDSLTDEPAGMRRTPSGMFMPYEEGEGATAAGDGIFGRVVDTYNTVRDITHVIWNVGWKK